MTENHNLYHQMLNDRDLLPVLATGPAGTGKTYSAVERAIEWLQDKRKKCVVTRPNVSFAKEGGYLPGTEREKIGPWVRPIEQNFKLQGVKQGQLDMWEKEQRLIYMPLEFIQGLTWDDSLIIVDEVQNMTFEQLKVFLTRTGKYSKVVMCGDIAQTSPRFKGSGLAEFVRMVQELNAPCHLIEFDRNDILRSPQCKRWIELFDQWEDAKHA